MATAIDPICQMDVDTGNPPGGQSEHEGTTYYFCAPGCKVAFDNEPEKYLSGAESGPAPERTPASRSGFLARLFGKK